MESETIARPAGRAIGVLLAPARWLERARGRRRLALVVLYLTVGAVLWWAMSLHALPDIGDPFDVRVAGRVDVPDEANAFVLYKQAAAKLHSLKYDQHKRLPQPPSWRLAPPEIRGWVEANREAMDHFRLGSERPASLLHQPRTVTIGSLISPAQELHDFARLGTLEAARLAEAGDMAGAWGWYRAVLRSSRHVSAHGTMIQGLIGTAMLTLTAGPATAWAADPRTDAPLLRRALRDAVACEAMAPRASDMLKVEYFSLMDVLAGPDAREYGLSAATNWYHLLPGSFRAERLLRREPERGRRVIRLAFANWLAYCDQHPNLRPPILRGEVDLFDAGTTAPTAARAIEPEKLKAWVKSSRLVSAFLPAIAPFIRSMDRDRVSLSALEITLAEQLYLRDHGKPPATLGDLLGPDLPRLPAGREPGDPSSLAPSP